MADTSILSRNFSLGQRRDDPRDQLPPGAAYGLTDYIPRDGSPLRKRGGWTMGTRDLGTLAPATSVAALGWAPFSKPHLIVVSDSHQLYSAGVSQAIDSVAGSAVGDALVTPVCPPFWHRDRMILLDGTLTESPLTPGTYLAPLDPMKYYEVSSGVYALAKIGGTPPRARTGWSLGDYLILANGLDPSSSYAYKPNRIWVSAVGNPDSWNTTASGGIFDMPDEVVGGVSMRNYQVVFGYSKVWALAGDTPPPGGNWTRRDLFSIGCMDVRSIATYGDYFIWANNTGIYKSDGASAPTDVTRACGLSLYWRSLVSSFNRKTGWKASAGILFGHYVISIINASGTNVATLAFNLEDDITFGLGNLCAGMFAQRLSGPGASSEPGGEELFMGSNASPRVARLSPMWTPSSSNALDGDGTPVLPVLETPYYKLGLTEQKRIRRIYLNYDLRTAGSAPKLVTGYALSPEATSYTEVDSTRYLPETTRAKRRAVDIRQRGEGFSLRIRQTAASTDTRISEVEVEGRAGEGSH